MCMCIYTHYHTEGEKELREQHQNEKRHTHTQTRKQLLNWWFQIFGMLMLHQVTPPEFDKEPENDGF